MLVEVINQCVGASTLSYTASGPGDDDEFLDEHPSDENPLDYENDNSSDSEWEKQDLFDDLLDDDADLEGDDDVLDDDDY